MLPLVVSNFGPDTSQIILCALVLIAFLLWRPAGTWSAILFASTILGLILICYTSWHRHHTLAKAAALTPEGNDHTQAASAPPSTL